MSSPPLPKGFTMRTQAGSTFLEIDLSHFDDGGIRQFAEAARHPRR